MSYDSHTNPDLVQPIVMHRDSAMTVLNMFKMITAFPNLCQSCAVHPESWRCHHKRVMDVSRFITIS